tara:strand:- start:4508 stop:4702 length:195 start_codon:yes stop_codon:yes gene_type:complete
MSWFNLTKKDNVDDAIDDKVKKILQKPRYSEEKIKQDIKKFPMSSITRQLAKDLVRDLREAVAN